MAAAPYAGAQHTDTGADARRGSEVLHEEALAAAFARIADDICIDGALFDARSLLPHEQSHGRWSTASTGASSTAGAHIDAKGTEGLCIDAKGTETHIGGARPGTPVYVPGALGCGTPLEDILAADRAPGGAFLPSSPLLRKVSAAEALQGAGFPTAVLVSPSPCSVAERMATMRSPPLSAAHPRAVHGGRVSPPSYLCGSYAGEGDASYASSYASYSASYSASHGTQNGAPYGAQYGAQYGAYTPPQGQRHFLFTPPPSAAHTKGAAEYTDFAPRTHAPPGGDYVCKLCAIPGHWLKDCPLYEPRGPTVGAARPAPRGTPGRPAVPPPNYVCRLCGVAGHWIEQCARFQARPPHSPLGHSSLGHGSLGNSPVMLPAAPQGAPPRGYVCNLCHQPGHWIQQCAEFVSPLRRF